ncbi:MAG TPA: class I SAM-dependent methyltransferase [Methylomirabilota bacterium]|nr:class I SAM-dependent methyltransferase [Methylomirabilota bacterium]
MRGERAPEKVFDKYAGAGAYHWRETGRHLLWHNAFTAERYRRVLAALGALDGRRVLDYGCGDGALLAPLSRAVGARGAVHGFDPTPGALEFAERMLRARGLAATLHRDRADIPAASFDRIACTEVIEHVAEPEMLLKDLARLLRPGGIAVVTTPVRLTERPEDPNHVHEWFPEEFADLLASAPLTVLRHEQVIPAAAAEVYFWRPRLCLRIPVFRLLCNALSITAGVNALSWLRLRPRLFMMQLAVLEKPR